MKFQSLKGFQKHVEGAEKSEFSGLYLVLSPNGVENHLALDLLVPAICRKERISSFGVKSFDAGRIKLKEIRDELTAFSLFAEKQIFLFHNAHQFSKEEGEILLGALKPGVFLILSGHAKNDAFYKKIEKAGVVLEIGSEKSWEKEKNIQEWALEYLKKEKKDIDSRALMWLVKEAAGDLSSLENELNKLVIYTYGRHKISFEDIHALAVKSKQANIFSLTDSLWKRDAKDALKICRQLFDDGLSFFVLIKQLRVQVQNQLIITSILKRGRSEDVSAHFPYMKGYILEKNVEIARSFGFERFKKALLLIDAAEFEAKNSNTSPELLMDLLTIRIIHDTYTFA